MKLIQYNIYFGDNLEERISNISKLLIDENADVICLQEVLNTSYPIIVGLLESTYPYIYPDKIDISYDTVIFSKHPFIKSMKHKFDFTMMGRNLKITHIQIDDMPIYIATTHFESEFKNKCERKIYQYNKCADILDQLYEQVFLCSDTNICINTEHIFHDTFSFASGWKDAWVEAGSDKNKATFDSYTNPILKTKSNAKYQLRLDRILHKSIMYCTEFKLIGNNPDIVMSDHYGISCVFSKIKPSDRPEYIDFLPKIKKSIPKLF